MKSHTSEHNWNLISKRTKSTLHYDRNIQNDIRFALGVHISLMYHTTLIYDEYDVMVKYV